MTLDGERRPGAFCAASVLFFAGLLWADRFVDRRGQLVLGLAAWAALMVACRTLGSLRRAQVAVVVLVATSAEVVGSILWGVYSYRLGNLPTFVPPCHGLVYLTGLRLSQTRLARHGPRAFVRLALAGALGWGLAGVASLPRQDLAGAGGVVLLAIFLLRAPSRSVYAGVFLAVGALELYGTALGTWTWAARVPGLGLSDGNPPSGAASGYVLFDIAALTLAPWLLSLHGRAQTAGAALAVRTIFLNSRLSLPRSAG